MAYKHPALRPHKYGNRPSCATQWGLACHKIPRCVPYTLNTCHISDGSALPNIFGCGCCWKAFLQETTSTQLPHPNDPYLSSLVGSETHMPLTQSNCRAPGLTASFNHFFELCLGGWGGWSTSEKAWASRALARTPVWRSPDSVVRLSTIQLFHELA